MAGGNEANRPQEAIAQCDYAGERHDANGHDAQGTSLLPHVRCAVPQICATLPFTSFSPAHSIGVVQGMLKMDPSKSSVDFCKFMSSFALAAYFALDNVSWLQKTTCITLSAENAMLVDRLCEGMFLMDVLFSFLPAVSKYNAAAAQERALVRSASC